MGTPPDDKATNQDSPKIISLTKRLPELNYAPIARVEAYWEGLRAGRLLPKRCEIDPRGLEHALEHAFILERITNGVARIRIAGSHLRDLMGMEVKGMPLTALLNAESRMLLADQIEDVCRMPAACNLHLSAAGSAARPPLEARISLLPLQSDLGDVSRVLGCWVSQGDLGLAPRRFDVITHQLRPLLSGAMLTPLSPPIAHTPAPRNRPNAPAATPTGGTKRPYLRLVSSED
jgi:hypothetical protein